MEFVGHLHHVLGVFRKCVSEKFSGYFAPQIFSMCTPGAPHRARTAIGDTATPRHRDTATPRHATPRHRDTTTPRHATPRPRHAHYYKFNRKVLICYVSIFSGAVHTPLLPKFSWNIIARFRTFRGPHLSTGHCIVLIL